MRIMYNIRVDSSTPMADRRRVAFRVVDVMAMYTSIRWLGDGSLPCT